MSKGAALLLGTCHASGRVACLAFLCLVLITPALAQEIPGPAPGRWRIVDVDDGLAREECVEKQETLGEMIRGLSEVDLQCTGLRFRREGSTIVGQGTCASEDVKISMDIRITGDLMKTWTSETVARFSPPPSLGLETVRQRFRATRLGAC